MLLLSTFDYALLARKLAIKTGRDDVCALPSGISVPHMFVVVFVVMLPILIATGNPIEAWSAGLTWVFVQSFVLMIGGFIAPVIRSEEHTSELQSLMRISYAVFCLKKKKKHKITTHNYNIYKAMLRHMVN